MKKILLVAGCSYSNEKFSSVHHPDLDVSWPKWPQLLAEKLDMQLVNLSESGAGQEYIYSNIIDKLQTIDHSKIGLVIAAWSTAPRRDYQKESLYLKNKKWTYDKNDMVQKIKWTNDMYDSKGCMYYWIDKSLRYYYSLQMVCENLKLPYKQFQMVDLFKGYLWQELISRRTNDVADNKQVPIINNVDDLTKEEKYWKETQEKKYLAQIHNSPYYEIINNNFIGWPTDPRLNGYSVGEKVLDNNTDRISKIDLHPNKQGQEKLARFIYDRLG
jgi:hypothetical protein|tara:strand:+ start:169 stop:984 length:816 start_codon:yes stop_codon:yes gene_type:complete